MSGYQYYEFLAVDRPLDERQLGKLRALSTRARITPTSLVNTYHWGDFRGYPRKLVERCFDAFLYLANWGTHQLMIRLPIRLLDIETAARYCAGESAASCAKGDHVILDLVSQDDSGDWEEQLASIIPARAELASGASECSAPDDTSQADLARWVEGLPVPEKNALLLRVAHGDDAHLRMELLRRFREQHRDPREAAPGSRTVGELLAAARIRRAEREALEAAQREQERPAASAPQRPPARSTPARCVRAALCATASAASEKAQPRHDGQGVRHHWRLTQSAVPAGTIHSHAWPVTEATRSKSPS